MINRQYQGRVNNAQGQLFEGRILAGCKHYRLMNWADIHKTPEPFRCLHKSVAGRFTGQFTAKAQPDFCGTLANGKSIVFEAKMTRHDRINKSVLTAKQDEILKQAMIMNARAFVCAEIAGAVFLIPYRMWEGMETIYKRKYFKPEDISAFEVRQDLNSVLFLDYKNSKQNQIELPDIEPRWLEMKHDKNYYKDGLG